jgi:hypothetical protein
LLTAARLSLIVGIRGGQGGRVGQFLARRARLVTPTAQDVRHRRSSRPRVPGRFLNRGLPQDAAGEPAEGRLGRVRTKSR